MWGFGLFALIRYDHFFNMKIITTNFTVEWNDLNFDWFTQNQLVSVYK